jgi:flagellar hook-basal body complex protein FliE
MTLEELEAAVIQLNNRVNNLQQNAAQQVERLDGRIDNVITSVTNAFQTAQANIAELKDAIRKRFERLENRIFLTTVTKEDELHSDKD